MCTCGQNVVLDVSWQLIYFYKYNPWGGYYHLDANFNSDMPGNLCASKNSQKQSILGGLTEARVFGSVSVWSVAWQRLTSS